MTPKEEAKELCNKFLQFTPFEFEYEYAKECALIAVKNKYHSLRELLFNLQSHREEIGERVYLYRIQRLIDEEQEVIEEINKL